MAYVALSVVFAGLVVGLFWLQSRASERQQSRAEQFLTQIIETNAQHSGEQVRLVAESVKATIEVVTKQVYGPSGTLRQPTSLESQMSDRQHWWLDEEVPPDPTDIAVMDPIDPYVQTGTNGADRTNLIEGPDVPDLTGETWRG